MVKEGGYFCCPLSWLPNEWQAALWVLANAWGLFCVPKPTLKERFIPHLLLVASTRAKARVLRDAYGGAMTSVEELVTDRTPPRAEDSHGAQRTRPTLVSKRDEPATDKQMMVLHSLALQLSFTDADISKLDSLTKQQASQTITELSAKVRDQKTERSASSL